jgi:general secretion pathway protein J
MVILSNDMTQVIGRSIISNSGDPEPAFLGTTDTVTFTHTGYINPDMQLQRSTLQRVAYSLDNNALVRTTWGTLDRAPDTEQLTRILLPNVEKISLRYLTARNQFVTEWPLKNTPEPEMNADESKERLPAITLLPKAIEITLTLKKHGDLTRLFLLPTHNSVYHFPDQSTPQPPVPPPVPPADKAVKPSGKT